MRSLASTAALLIISQVMRELDTVSDRHGGPGGTVLRKERSYIIRAQRISNGFSFGVLKFIYTTLAMP